MKYTAIIIASATVAFCVQAYAKAQAYMDARREMQAAAKATRENEAAIAEMYEQLTAAERVRGDAEVK